MQDRTAETPPALSVTEALVPVASLVILVGLSFYLFGEGGADGPNQIALVVASLVAVFIGWRRGYTLDALREAAVASVGTGVGAMFILFAVGSLVGTWAMSGTLMAMVYYGLQILSPHYLYMTSAIICGLVSLCIGSSWTVVSTIGIGLMGIAINMDLDPAITAAAIISGAYLGDKSSPLSDSTNLAAVATGANLYEHIVETLWTSMPAFLLALGFFWFLGEPGDFDASEKIASIHSSFNITPILFLPLVVVLALAILKFPPFTTIFTGAIAGGLLAVWVSPERVIAFANDADLSETLALLKGVWQALASGYQSSTGDAGIDQLLSRGGMASMLGTIWLVITALAFGGVVEKIGALECLIAPLIRKIKSIGALVASLVGATITTNVVTADQYIAIVLPGRMFKNAFRERGYRPVVLSRAIGDTATVTSALIPWNSCGAFMAATLGVATVSYAPFAFFNILSPLMTILFAFMGWRMLRAPQGPDAPLAPPAPGTGASEPEKT